MRWVCVLILAVIYWGFETLIKMKNDSWERKKPLYTRFCYLCVWQHGKTIFFSALRPMSNDLRLSNITAIKRSFVSNGEVLKQISRQDYACVNSSSEMSSRWYDSLVICVKIRCHIVLLAIWLIFKVIKMIFCEEFRCELFRFLLLKI